MHIIEISIVLGYFIILVIIGEVVRKKTKNISDYTVAGRNMGTFAVTCSIIGLWLGGLSTIGISEMAYSQGLFPIFFNFSIAVGMVVLSFTVAKYYRKLNAVTVGDIIERLFSRRVKRFVSINFVIAAVILVSLQLQAAGTLASSLFNVDNNIAIVVTGTVILLYVTSGGMKSLAVTNIVHVILLYVTIFASFVVVFSISGGFEGLGDLLNTGFVKEGLSVSEANQKEVLFMNPFSPGMDKAIAWFIGVFLAVFSTQASLQPIFSSKNSEIAKRSSIISALFIAPLGFMVSIIGVYARSISTEIGIVNAKDAFPFVLMKSGHFSPIFAGLVSAGIFAAIISTLAPTLFASSTIIVKDFIYGRGQEDNPKMLKIGKIVTLTIGVLVIPFAIFFNKGILESAYFTYAIRCSSTIIILLGLVRKFFKIKWIMNDISAILSVIFSILGVGIYIVIPVEYLKTFQDNFGFFPDKVYFSLVSTVIGLVIGWGLTRMMEKK
ncbi:MAG: sodium:solute symporter family protein [Candidatus Delongbacteria bacterium]|nr:sodium:solute symporter family protein [Candidatus Delongbacteria bacterium]MBN2834103.1 sodium:solute symporter family protein [Candidatus Delongbacteria bacterium]